MFFRKQKHETVFFRNYKKFDNSAFREALNRELLRYDLSNIEFDTLQEIIVSPLNVHAPFKEKISQSKSCKFCDKEQDLETSTLNNVLKQQRLHIISKEINVLAF